MADFATLVLAADSRGLVSGEQALDKLASTAERTENRTGKSMVGLAKSTEQVGRQSIFATQQSRLLAMQLSQVGQQASATGNWIQAIAIQLPDMALGFGTIGIAAGVAAGALLPLVANLVSSGDEAEALEKAFDNLKSATEAYEDAVESASTSADALIGKFGEQAEGAQRVYEALRRLRELEFNESIRQAQEAISSTLGGLQDSMSRFREASDLPDFLKPEAIGLVRTEVEYLANEFGVTLVQATRINDALDALASATGPAEIADAAGRLGLELQRASDEGAKLSPELRDVQKDAYSASLDAARFSKLIGDAIGPTNNLAGAMGGVADEAARAAQNAAATVSAIQTGLVTAQLKANSSLDPLNGFNRTPFEDEQQIMNRRAEATKSQYQLTMEKLNRSRGGGRRGGKTEAAMYDDIVSAANRRITSLEAEKNAIGLTDEAAAKLLYTTDLFNDAQQKGINLSGPQREQLTTLAETMARVEEETRQASEAMEFQKDVLHGIFGDLRDALDDGKITWEEFGDIAMGVLDKVIDKIEDDLVNAMVNLNSGSAGGGGFLSGLFSLFGGGGRASADPWAGMRVASFDGGGYTGKRSRSGGMDGKGGFMALLHPDETVIDHTRGQGTGGQNVKVTSDVRVSVDNNGNLKAFVERTSARTSGDMITQFSREALPGRVNEISQDPRAVG